MKKMYQMVLLGAAALALAACGSSNSDNQAPAAGATTDIPVSAQTDGQGLTNFLNAQISASSDTSEPILVGDAVLPVDDKTETSL